MLNNLKAKITGGVLAATMVLPPGLHYAATGYLTLEERVANTAYHWKLEALRYVGLQPVPTQTTIDQILNQAAQKYGLSPALLHAVAQQESKKNPTAYSLKGATGVMQIMPFNHARCGLAHPGRLWLEEENIPCGARILSEELRSYRDLRLALMAYNWGSGNVQKWIKAGRPESQVPAETRQYVANILADVGRRVVQ
jgi:soluble lytic murein transglycosylase-like protein